ncbi:AraC family transcriptional regulator [Paracoccus sp. TOH]|uniref:AraC family transcriptional regulator n=1 Tax=Paracoccus sp. TOH TaxID=1263728 RepID=UPI0025B1BC40|nr:AraC family transcriptional regulator [Paracoccus sp. TOH]WJS87193.1 AraC family transcriptional regulator [Paracoccus sp. TOH]WJS87318.1 AraC family transcriptional regulator [Paracoccus sp. TOH]
MDTPLEPLGLLIERQFGRFGHETPLDGLLLSRAVAPSGIICSVFRPSLCVVVQGAQVSTLGDRPFQHDAGQGMLVSIDVPIIARITQATADRPYLAFNLEMDLRLQTH